MGFDFLFNWSWTNEDQRNRGFDADPDDDIVVLIEYVSLQTASTRHLKIIL